MVWNCRDDALGPGASLRQVTKLIEYCTAHGVPKPGNEMGTLLPTRADWRVTRGSVRAVVAKHECV